MAKFFTPTKLSDNIRETPEGFLVCLSVPIARTGWQVYGPDETPLEPGEDGLVHVHRDASAVFNPKTIASYLGKAFTINHPNQFVDPNNWKDLAKGVLQNIRKSDEKDEDGEESLLADVLVTDAIAIGLIKRGLREVSCGYEAVYEQTGEGKGRQIDIIGNHLALVEQGRAGPYYAINDHQRERLTMKNWKDKAKAYFVKAIDEAPEAMDESAEKKEDKKEEKMSDAASYDELVKMVKDLGEKIEAMNKPKDEAPKEEASKEEDEEMSDEDMEKKEEKASDEEVVAASVEERLKAIELAVAKLMEMESEEQSEMGDEEMCDDDDESDLVGDTKARAEILSPGIQITKDVKAKALKAAYGTKEGKAVIDSLTHGKAPSFDSAEKVSALFIAASEILKAKRGTGLEKSRKTIQVGDAVEGPPSPEKLNQMNKAFWSLRK